MSSQFKGTVHCDREIKAAEFEAASYTPSTVNETENGDC